jgi:hypothetical protein
MDVLKNAKFLHYVVAFEQNQNESILLLHKMFHKKGRELFETDIKERNENRAKGEGVNVVQWTDTSNCFSCLEVLEKNCKFVFKQTISLTPHDF